MIAIKKKNQLHGRSQLIMKLRKLKKEFLKGIVIKELMRVSF